MFNASRILVVAFYVFVINSTTTYASDFNKRIFDLRIPMRDGIMLSSDVWLPPIKGKYPIILMRTPYLKSQTYYPEIANYFTKNGYIFIVQDVRGRGDSEGTFNYYHQEADDGYDAIEWLAKRKFSNGRICMLGGSYLGTVQWQAAKKKPPHLKCIASTAAAGDYFNEGPYIGGALRHQNRVYWLNLLSGNIDQSYNITDSDLMEVSSHRPLLTTGQVLGRKIPLYRKWLQHHTFDDYWKTIYLEKKDFSKIDIPALHITGWFDANQPGAMHYWKGMANHSPASKHQYLLVGPWNHIQSIAGGQESLGELDFSSDSIIDFMKLHLMFFDRYLKQSTDSFSYPAVKLYVTGINRWEEYDLYPVSKTKTKRLYLSSNGFANSRFGDGELINNNLNNNTSDQYIFDPKNPVPLEDVVISSTSNRFATDRRSIERRDDILVYTSKKLAQMVKTIGQVSVELYAATDGRDTDFTASIVDVYPDGRAVVLGHRVSGIIRARYRKGYDKIELVEPGKIEKYVIDLGHIAHAFLPGHKIRVEISSSAAPFYNPNQNTGNPIATDTEWRVAHQTIYHGKKYPSSLLLPIIPVPQ